MIEKINPTNIKLYRQENQSSADASMFLDIKIVFECHLQVPSAYRFTIELVTFSIDRPCIKMQTMKNSRHLVMSLRKTRSAFNNLYFLWGNKKQLLCQIEKLQSLGLINDPLDNKPEVIPLSFVPFYRRIRSGACTGRSLI